MSSSLVKKLGIVALVLAVFFALGFRVGHPDNGLKSALGSAKSSLAIYKTVGQAEIGSKVLVDAKDVGLGLGIAKSASGGNVDVDLGYTFVRVSQKDVQGKLIAVIPFFGTLFGIVGL